MSDELLIKSGAIFHLICALSHIFYPGIFKWSENLKDLHTSKKIVILHNLNLSNVCMLLFWLMLAYIPFFYSNELLTTGIGKSLLTSVIVFWTVRIFILQPLFGGFKTKASVLRTLFFLSGFLLFLIPWKNVFFQQ